MKPAALASIVVLLALQTSRRVLPWASFGPAPENLVFERGRDTNFN